MDRKAEVAAYDRFKGVAQSADIIAVDAKANKKDVTLIARIQAALVNARGKQAKALLKQFDKVSARLDKNIASQVKVIEDEIAADKAKDKAIADDRKARLGIAKENLAESKRANKVREATAAQARVDNLKKEIRDEEAKEADAEAKADKERLERESKEKIAGVKAAEKQAAASLETHEQRRTHEASVLKIEYTAAKAAREKANDKFQEFKERVEEAEDLGTYYSETVNKGQEGLEKTDYFVKNGTITDNGAMILKNLHNAVIDANTIMTDAKAAWDKKALPPIKPETKGQKITKEIWDAYRDFYGSEDAARQAAKQAGWSTIDDDPPAPDAKGEGATQAEIDAFHAERWGGPKAPPGIWDKMTEPQREECSKIIDASVEAPWPTKPKKKGDQPTKEILKQYKAKYQYRAAIERMLKEDGWKE